MTLIGLVIIIGVYHIRHGQETPPEFGRFWIKIRTLDG